MNHPTEIMLTDIECADNRTMSGIDELAANINSVGLINPITLAPSVDGGKPWRVIAGRRRFRALERLGRDRLAAGEFRICESDQTALTAYSENAIRADLTLAEEVEQLAKLRRGNSVAELAAMIGRSVDWCALRLNLANLTPEWRKVLVDREKYPHWTAGKLELIARLPASRQKELCNDYFFGRTFSVSELAKELDKDQCRLTGAKWVSSECASCPKRSGAAAELFPEFAAEKADYCLDTKCAEKLISKFMTSKAEELIAEHAGKSEPFYLVSDGNRSPEYGSTMCKLVNKHCEDIRHFTKNTKKNGSPNAFCIWGTSIGQYLSLKPKYDWIKPINPEKSAGKDGKNNTGKDGSATGKSGKTLADREAELTIKRNREAYRVLAEQLADPELFRAVMCKHGGDPDRANAVPPVLSDILFKLAAFFGLERSGYSHAAFAAHYRKLVAPATAEFLREILRQIAHRMTETLRCLAAGKLIDPSFGRDCCEVLQLDWRQIETQAIQNVPPSKVLLAQRAAKTGQSKK